MKKIILSLAGTLIMCTAGTAQNSGNFAPNAANTRKNENKSPEERAQKDADRAAIKLGLDATQKTQWQAASLERISANEPLRAQQQAATDQSEKQKIGSQMRENQKMFEDKINGFLTADQKVKWEDLKKEKKDFHRAKMNQSSKAPATN